LPVPHIYTIGRIEARLPRLSVEKEFAQAAGRAETAGQTDQQAFYKVLSKPESRYPEAFGFCPWSCEKIESGDSGPLQF
jgi:PatG Domain